MAASKNNSRKKHARRKPTGKNSWSAPSFTGQARLLATLAVAGVFIWALYSIARVDLEAPYSESSSTYNDPRQDMPNSTKNAVDAAAAQPSNSADHDYSFYSLLRDFKIEVPKGNFQQDRANSTNPVTYIIQAGSFKTARQAEQRLVELKLLGLNPEIDDNINSRGELWYRVMLGPYTRRSDMANTRATIISNNIEAMVMERKL